MKSFYIDYPQEKIGHNQHLYRCAKCKIPTTVIFGLLENHAKSCEYRLKQHKWVQLEAKLKPHKERFDESFTDEVD